ncbi:hypothetical protein [Nonomuraea sp. NPDC001831]|uniref:S53 family peptidase n=1 Tax=Nonomuraea sp. NPDC001831 TaxID=3364340 RepID=UPI0036CC1BFA
MVKLIAAAAAALLLAGPAVPAQADPARSCPAARAGSAGCLLTARPAAEAKAAGLPQPFSAADLQQAYRLPSARLGGGQTIAVIVPYHNPNAGNDLAVYRKANGLPPCEGEFDCFRQVNQRGGDEPPGTNPDWSLNSSAALDIAAAACPNCRLLLVEADDAGAENLGLAVDQAVRQGATVVTTPYGLPEYAGELAHAAHYAHPGVPVTAPSGDSGFPARTGRQLVPAAYGTVTAVGGTTLYRQAGARGWGETAWSGSGSGCSVYVTRPAWQPKGACGAKRTVADTAAVADLRTPVAVYDSYSYGGWVAVGGTPIAAALVAGVYALAGNGDLITPGRQLQAGKGHLFDITAGRTGACAAPELCNARPGYDGPTGYGSPDGIGAF